MTNQQSTPIDLSIVTPTLNLCLTLERTIDSVLQQSCLNFEYIVIDGGSTDGTIEILKKYERKFPDKQKFRWISEPDKGQTDAINKGLKLAQGRWFAWINADDYYEPNVFKQLAPALDKPSDVAVIYGKNFTHGFNGLPHLDQPLSHLQYSDWFRGNQIYQPASIFRTALLRKVGGFDSNLTYWMDYDMYMRLAKHYRFHYLDLVISHFCQRAGQKSTNPKNQRAMAWEAYRVCRRRGSPLFSPLLKQALKV